MVGDASRRAPVCCAMHGGDHAGERRFGDDVRLHLGDGGQHSRHGWNDWRGNLRLDGRIRGHGVPSNPGTGKYSAVRPSDWHATGLRNLDDMTTGIREGELWTIGSWTGEGKSVLAAQIIRANAQEGGPVLWFINGSDIIIVGKQREGTTGSVKVSFDGQKLTFEERDYDNRNMHND